MCSDHRLHPYRALHLPFDTVRGLGARCDGQSLRPTLCSPPHHSLEILINHPSSLTISPLSPTATMSTSNLLPLPPPGPSPSLVLPTPGCLSLPTSAPHPHDLPMMTNLLATTRPLHDDEDDEPHAPIHLLHLPPSSVLPLPLSPPLTTIPHVDPLSPQPPAQPRAPLPPYRRRTPSTSLERPSPTFTLLSVIGRGGYGKVFLCQHIDSGSDCTP